MGIYSGRSGRRWRRLCTKMRDHAIAFGLPCWICKEPFDFSVHHNHPRAFTVDHKIPIAVAPWLAEEWSNLRPAHRSCNSSKGKRPTASPKMWPKPKTSRAW